MDTTIPAIGLLTILIAAKVAFAASAAWFNPHVFGKPWRHGSNIQETTEQGLNRIALFFLFIGLPNFSALVFLTKFNLPVTILITNSLLGIVVAIAVFTNKSRNAVLVEAGYILLISIVIKLIHRFI